MVAFSEWSALEKLSSSKCIPRPLITVLSPVPRRLMYFRISLTWGLLDKVCTCQDVVRGLTLQIKPTGLQPFFKKTIFPSNIQLIFIYVSHKTGLLCDYLPIWHCLAYAKVITEIIPTSCSSPKSRHLNYGARVTSANSANIANRPLCILLTI